MLLKETVGLRHQVEDSAKHGKTDDDAMYHLEMAQKTLKERYCKLQKRNTELEKRLDQMMMKQVLLLLSLIIHMYN